DAEKPKLDHAIGGGSWAARNLRLEGVHRCRRADRVRAALSRPLSSCSHLRRQNSSRCQSFQSSCRATDEIRADHQPQSRKGDRASGAYGIDGSRRRGDRIRAALLRLLTAAFARTGCSTMSAPSRLVGVKRKCCERHQFDAPDPMYGPAVRCKRILPMWRMCGLASMYPAFDWSLLCSGAIMDISARAISLADRPQRAKRVTSVRMRREDRSSISFLILSQTSAGNGFRL